MFSLVVKQHQHSFQAQCNVMMLEYEEARKQVLIFNTMFAFACTFYNHGSIRPKLQNIIYRAHQDLSRTSKNFEIQKKITKLWLLKIFKVGNFDSFSRKSTNHEKCKGKLNANHHITTKLSQNLTSMRHNFFRSQYLLMI